MAGSWEEAHPKHKNTSEAEEIAEAAKLVAPPLPAELLLEEKAEKQKEEKEKRKRERKKQKEKEDALWAEIEAQGISIPAVDSTVGGGKKKKKKTGKGDV